MNGFHWKIRIFLSSWAITRITHFSCWQGFRNIYSCAVSSTGSPGKEGFASSSRQQRWGRWLPRPRHLALLLPQGVWQNTRAFCQLWQRIRMSTLKHSPHMLTHYYTLQYKVYLIISYYMNVLFLSSVAHFSVFCFSPSSSPYCLMDPHHHICAKCTPYTSSEIPSFHLLLMRLLFL